MEESHASKLCCRDNCREKGTVSRLNSTDFWPDEMLSKSYHTLPPVVDEVDDDRGGGGATPPTPTFTPDKSLNVLVFVRDKTVNAVAADVSEKNELRLDTPLLSLHGAVAARLDGMLLDDDDEEEEGEEDGAELVVEVVEVS